MSEDERSAWKRLVDQLHGTGYESEYLDRLRAYVSAEEQALLRSARDTIS